ncbi:protein IWS1 homolog [Trichonephila clavata]|uniref:Protein IWS1 homolog n=1 Tax=Trichonephila clavata TaxID=2740835 RepID=A0A8X6HBT3_TRICU|nr:protein IWS1 homolog [Trichonephila clavata]
MSDNENRDSDEESAVKENDEEKDEEKETKSDNEGSIHSDGEESEQENIPEVNIESADEDEEDKHSDKMNASDNESADEEGKDDQSSVHVGSDVENKSDDEEERNDQENRESSPNSPSSPIQTEEKELENDEPKSKKHESDGEENAESESDGESDESEVGGLIADIFGESDEDEEFEGFNEDDIGAGKSSKDSPAKVKKDKRKRAKIMSDSEDEKEDQEKEENEGETSGIIEDVPAPPAEEEENEEIPIEEEPPKKKKKVEDSDSDDDVDRKMREDFVSDFDLMMLKKKEENSKRRRRRDVDLISDSDDLIADIISQMRQAAEEDKILNEQRKTATKKLKILPMVMSQLKKQDLKTAFLDQGILNVIAEWLTPLPDRSLPHLNIREGMLKQLSDLPSFDQSLLKSSGIGRALMYLFKHPKETKGNRALAGKLITEWARPIFNVTTNYHSLTKEEREQRDYDHVPKQMKRKDRDSTEDDSSQQKNIEKDMESEKTTIRPGDKGWIGRARVPMPSTKDYVNRPKWNVEMEFGRGPSKKPLSRIEKHMRSLQDKKRLNKQQRAITISIEGRKMAI